MSRRDPIQGDLQEHVMRVMWKRDRATVEDVRQALPAKRRGAYTTVQTVLVRLLERGLLKRQKVGKAFLYSAAVSEADYIAGSLSRALAGASEEARRSALASLVGDLGASEMDEINLLARQIDRKRRKSG